ncbi:hypothetical protein EUGRSUZ_H01053 [Eucalyptus grandis]|uniref:Uncharacterized protein n=2 Tax=Eucalyptus grandis TaxID=71139 RepID=A0ACC3JMW8_EUCGR|nr:hypothetical protein EUGRSUZ_H01053 [Eucalyptus grandis]
MGNLPSCCARPCRKEAALFDPDGKLWRLPTPVKAAEVMLEVPGHIVVPVEEIWRSQRIVAMHADDELALGKAYLAVPARQMNRKVDEVELAAIESTLKRKRIGTGKQGEAKTTKSKGGTLYVAILEKEKGGGGGDGGGTGGSFNPQLISCSRRQWNPVLEPILEDN